jgi:hypothetical protein
MRRALLDFYEVTISIIPCFIIGLEMLVIDDGDVSSASVGPLAICLLLQASTMPGFLVSSPSVRS